MATITLTLISTMAHVDDTVVFERMLKNCYGSLDGFLEDFREFQGDTCTSVYIYASMTAKQLIRERKFYRKLTLPEVFPYYFIKYCCVHHRRRGATATRLQNIDCPAFVGIRAVGREYRVMKRYLVHNHDFHVRQRGLYTSNRRLSGEQEEEVSTLMDDLRSTRELRDVATHMFRRS
ncbi:unnamed protein product [Echinostoma caproni]|uniref:FLYWCH-type domain-containing protein n=1 Tax=Echinostoma caproni TaxID=27848 RepID=A0A183BE95_9TREM|nr:unnamed protein product [Echinostoma caproni]